MVTKDLSLPKDKKKSKITTRFGDYSEIESSKIHSLLMIIIVLIIWAIVGYFELFPPLFWPPLPTLAKTFYSLVVDGYSGLKLYQHLVISLMRVIAGFSLACIFGIPLGMLMGLNGKIRGFMDPIIELYRPVPPLAFIPLVIIWMGIGDTGKIFLLFLAGFSVMVINSRSGVESVEIEKIQAAYTLGASKWHVLTRVIFINSLPAIFTGMRVAMGSVWGTLVAAEMIASVSGIGWTTMNASRFLMTDVVFIGIIVMGGCGYLFDLIIRNIEKKVIPWKGKY
jgi:taurine transport system permease protein